MLSRRNAIVLPLDALCTSMISLWGSRKQKLWSLSLLCAFLLPISALQYRGYRYYVTEREETRPLSRPYMVGLFSRRRLFCAGTLVKDNWVLTAAHCFPNEDSYVILGATSRTKREPRKRVANITKTFSYPGFNLLTYEHDIMLLQIQIKGRFNENGKIIPLPKTPEDIMPGTQCRVIGWGTIHQRMGSDMLHEVNATIFDRKICNDKKHYHREPVVTAHMLCAGDRIEKMDKCLGDSGSPLICNGRQRGILSFVKKCNDHRYPGIYTRITKDHLFWIQTIIHPRPN